MKKIHTFLNKKVTIALMALLITFGGSQVYAAVALDSNIVALIQQGMTSLEEFLMGDAENDVQDYSHEKQIALEKYIESKTQEVINELGEYQQDQVGQSNDDLDQYVEELKSAIEKEINDRKDNAKNKIKNKIDEKTAGEKEKIKNKMIDSIESMIVEFENIDTP